ncbi:MAG: alcohol dehydrogenase catalytic domain-containing protein [Candidatus Thorarchaeota archaeon]|nr:alcohol dehydrogenase catalytic domain-containing protein [Candidatus Thorarchaeota archaeon]
MHSLVLTQDGLQVADMPQPPVMPGEVRIEVRAVGICGTDIEIWQGEKEAPLPLILGHEISGVVHKSSVSDIEQGMMVTTEVDLSCGRCWYCKQGHTHICPKRKTIGIDVDGGMAEYLSVPASLIHPLPEDVSIQIGIFAEPLASAIGTAKQTGIKDNEPIAVIGSGRLGLLVAQVYDAYGAEVYLIGRNKWQLGLARRLGLRNTLLTSEDDWIKAIRDATQGVGPRVTVECTGTPEGAQMALKVVRSRGIVALKSLHGKNVPINTDSIVMKELRIIGSSRGPYDEALDMLQKGRIEVNRLVSKEFPLEKGEDAFRYSTKAEATKVIVRI